VSDILPADFDGQSYLDLNPDVRIAGVDPAEHFLKYGISEGRTYRKSIKGLEAELAEFLTQYPSDQNAFDLFPESWSTIFEGVKTNGTAVLSNDLRIKWLLERVDVASKSVLELGPLEAGHTYMLEKAGANVLSIEANKGAFLRCLIVKNYLGMNSKFLLGDFEQFNWSDKFDMIVASGVLYHMREPVALLEKLSHLTNKIFLWTHYFEPNLELWNKDLKSQLESGKWDIENPSVVEIGQLKIKTVKQHYGEALGWTGFCGGTESYSNWLYRQDLLSLLGFLGFNNIELSFDEPAHQNGPAFCVLAQKQ